MSTDRATELFGETATVELRALARALFPHEGLGDGPYQRAVDTVIAHAALQPPLAHTIADGLRDLRISAAHPLGETPAAELQALLAQWESTQFFSAVRALVAYALYDDREVWDYIGYPGAAFEHGGYLNRGFADLTWLPEPRTEESDLPFAEIGPLRVVDGVDR